MTGNRRLSLSRMDELKNVVDRDVSTGHYFGASIKIAHAGELLFDHAAGFADEAKTSPITQDSVFSIFSCTKAFINVLILRAIEHGRFALTTRMSEIIPEFSGAPRDRATIFHFLTHTTGIPGMWEVRPGMYQDNLDEMVAAVCEAASGNSEPGDRCDYSPMVNHVLLGEVLRRTDPARRSINEILEADLFGPLGMKDSGLGIRPHMKDRHVIPDMRGTVPIKALSRTTPGDNGLYEAEVNEATWVGAASTSGDLLRFAEMLRRGGELDGNRIISPRMIALARQNWTGDLPNEIYKAVALRAGYTPPPAYLGLGFSLRGSAMVRHQFGTLTTAETFGNYGAGSTLYWIDPELDLVFVALTAGLLNQAANIERFQKLSDIAVGALQ